jgi:integrase/recombinase XerD
MTPSDFSKLLTSYLTVYLPLQRNVSGNTIASYCDAFRILLAYARDVKGVSVERLTLKNLTRSFILDFLEWLENDRGCSISTRNQRLAAIHSFARYVQVESPLHMLQFQDILSIYFKKKQKPTISYLTADDMRLLLRQPDSSTEHGRRDLALLTLLYDTGARVQELADLHVRDIRLDAPAYVHLTGKGRKSRNVPLMNKTCDILLHYMKEHRLIADAREDIPLFSNSRGVKLSRAGVAYIVNKYATKASALSSLIPKKVTPHILRHTKAMHLLQADVNLVYIRDILGHSDVATTEIYAKADLQMKRIALSKAAEVTPISVSSWIRNTELLEWLRNYGRSQTEKS